jgi:hypothetical protein
MDEGEPSQLYKTLLLEQEYNPSQAVEILIAYYQMSEEEAWLVSKQYHAARATRGIDGYNNKKLINSHKISRRTTSSSKKSFPMAKLRGRINRP